MKKLTQLLTAMLLTFGFAISQNCSAQSYDVSTLYLKVHNNLPFTVTLNGETHETSEKVFVKEGLRPGKYLLMVTQLLPENDMHIVAGKPQRVPNKERLMYYGFIEVTGKKLIMAVINENGDFIILKQKRTTSVCLPPPANAPLAIEPRI